MRATALALVALLLGASCRGPAASSGSAADRLAPPLPGNLYHGVYPGGQTGEEDDITLADVASYEETVGMKVAWVYFSNNWYSSQRFPRQTAQWIRDSGALPFIRLMLRGENNTSGPYTLASIVAGDHDAALQQWAREARAFGTPLLVEYGTEVNGDWFPWNGAHNGGGQADGFDDPTKPDGPERFVAAFRHIVNVMRGAGATNINWVFHVNASDWPQDAWNRLENYYPGDAYVTWIGVSAYGPQEPTDTEWETFRAQMDPCYARLDRLAPTKPVIALEFGGTAGSPLAKPEDWAGAALTDLLGHRWPRIIGFSWWNERWQNDSNSLHDTTMRVQDTPALAAVFHIRLEVAKDEIEQRPRFITLRHFPRPE